MNKTTTPTIYELVDTKVKGHVFVNGNTKHLVHMNQKDLEVLFKNGDPRVKEKNAPAVTSIPETKKESKA